MAATQRLKQTIQQHDLEKLAIIQSAIQKLADTQPLTPENVSTIIEPLLTIVAGNQQSGTPDISTSDRERKARHDQVEYEVQVHERILGERAWTSAGSSKRRKKYKGQAKVVDIDWAETLQQALYYDPSMYSHIRDNREKWKRERHVDTSTLSHQLRDYMDAEAWRTHPNLGDTTFPASDSDDEPFKLAFALYYDAVSLPNQQGAFRHEHKLGLFYVIVLNLPPEVRSRVQNIWLSSVVLEPDLTFFGPEAVICGDPNEPPMQGTCIRAVLNRFQQGINLQVYI